MLIDIFSGREITKVIDFLIDNMGADYTKTDIAIGSSVSRPTVQDIIQKLLQMEIVLPTRRLGHTELYKLNTTSPLVKSLIAFDGEVSKIMFEAGIESSDEAEPNVPESSISASGVNESRFDEMYSHSRLYGWPETSNAGIEHHDEKNPVPVIYVPKRFKRSQKTQEA